MEIEKTLGGFDVCHFFGTRDWNVIVTSFRRVRLRFSGDFLLWFLSRLGRLRLRFIGDFLLCFLAVFVDAPEFTEITNTNEFWDVSTFATCCKIDFSIVKFVL